MYVIACTSRGFTFRLADEDGVLMLFTGPQAQMVAALHKRLFGYQVKIERFNRQPRYVDYGADNLLGWEGV